MERLGTLREELREWKEIEDVVAQSFSGDTNVKKLLKMQLKEYDRMYKRFKGNVYTKDDKALMIVLEHRRKNLERELYPGLLRRIIHRTAKFVRSSLDYKSEAEMARGFWYDESPRSPDYGPTVENEQKQERYEARHTHGFDMGPKKNQEGKSQRLSL